MVRVKVRGLRAHSPSPSLAYFLHACNPPQAPTPTPACPPPHPLTSSTVSFMTSMQVMQVVASSG